MNRLVKMQVASETFESKIQAVTDNIEMRLEVQMNSLKSCLLKELSEVKSQIEHPRVINTPTSAQRSNVDEPELDRVSETTPSPKRDLASHINTQKKAITIEILYL